MNGYIDKDNHIQFHFHGRTHTLYTPLNIEQGTRITFQFKPKKTHLVPTKIRIVSHSSRFFGYRPV